MEKQKKLKDSILKKVYLFETRKTTTEIVLRAVFLVVLGFLAFTFGTATYEILKEQKTLDLLEIFEEDTEVIRRYVGEVTATVFQELPKIHTVVLLLILVALIIFIWRLSKKMKTIKNKVQSLIHYWHAH